MAFPLNLKSREYFTKRLGSLKNDRQTFIPHYRDLSTYVVPRRGRFLSANTKDGANRYEKIINSQATQALRSATAGLFAGTMSPSRPWFRLVVSDPDLMEIEGVRIWLERQEKLLRAIFNQSNLYTMAPVMLGELLQFATGCMTHVDDFHDVARFYAHTVGSYMISQNDRFEVDTVVREFKRTVIQLMKQFEVKGQSINNVSFRVKDAYNRGEYDKEFDVVHFIEPNPSFVPDSDVAQDFKWRSVYYEPDSPEPKSFLSLSGFREFPAYVPRWGVTGEDVYGTDCPGMLTLGDVKGLQMMERRKAQGIDKIINPPLRGPAELANVPISTLPGGSNFYNAPGNQKLEPIYSPEFSVRDMVQDIDKVERRIDTGYFADLFDAITNMEGIQPRGQEEILQRNEERLLKLGPVLERVHGEFLSKMVDRTFNQGERAGIISEAPDEIKGTKMEIRFISTLAMAQRAVAVGGIERFTAYMAGLAQIKPESVDKFDADQSADEFALAIGVPSKIVVPDADVAKLREKRAQEQQALMMQEALKDVGPTAVQAAGLDLSGDTVAAGLAGPPEEV